MTVDTSLSDIKLIIFDWDGTLFNSIDTIVESILYVAHQLDLPVCRQKAQSVIGLALPIALQEVFPHQSAEMQEQILATYLTHNIPASAKDTWFDGIEELLLALKQRGYLLAVATGKARVGLDRVLDRTGSRHIFATTRGADEAKSKPDPLMLQQILDELGVSIHQSIMVGDSAYDLDMAQRIGMRSVGVSYGVHTVEVLAHHQPIAIASDVVQLSEILLNLDRSKNGL